MDEVVRYLILSQIAYPVSSGEKTVYSTKYVLKLPARYWKLVRLSRSSYLHGDPLAWKGVFQIDERFVFALVKI